MTVYVDILLFINTVVDFIILSATCVLVKSRLKLWRKILASLSGAMFSLYIFLPPLGFWFGLLLRLSASVTAVLIAFGFKNVRRYLRCLGVFYAVSFIYCGGMAGIWMLFEPQKMSVNNGVVYFDVSPLLLITLSFVFYVILTVVRKLTGREAEYSKRISVGLQFLKQSVEVTAMVDTGHTMSDGIGNSTVVVIDTPTAVALFGVLDTELMTALQPPENIKIKVKFRLVPIKTVSGEAVMPAVKIDRLKVTEGKKTFVISHPLAVIASEQLADDYSAIIPPEALNN